LEVFSTISRNRSITLPMMMTKEADTILSSSAARAQPGKREVAAL
jgi:hypothetical protein